jgi:hypothetical protein
VLVVRLLPAQGQSGAEGEFGLLGDGDEAVGGLLADRLDEAVDVRRAQEPGAPRQQAQACDGIRECSLLTREPQTLPVRPAIARVVVPAPVWGAGSAERLAANAQWCRTCRALADAPTGAAGSPWVLLHRSEPERLLSTWTYPTEKDALHHGAHLAMTYLQDDGPLDRVALDLFTGQAHAQVIARFLELHPETTQFEVAELVPMRADEF